MLPEVIIILAVVAAFTRIMVVALARPTGPVTINAQGAIIQIGRAPLPRTRPAGSGSASSNQRCRGLH